MPVRGFGAKRPTECGKNVNQTPESFDDRIKLPMESTVTIARQANDDACGPGIVAYFIGGDPSAEKDLTYAKVAKLSRGRVLGTCLDVETEAKRSEHPMFLFGTDDDGEGFLLPYCKTANSMLPCDFEDATAWVTNYTKFIILYTHKDAYPSGHYIGLEKLKLNWAILDPKIGKAFTVKQEDVLMIIRGADVVIGVPTLKRISTLNTTQNTELVNLIEFMQTPSETKSREAVAWIRDQVDNDQPLGHRDALAMLRATGGRVPARKLLGSRADLFKYLEAYKGFRSKTGTATKHGEICTEEEVQAKMLMEARSSTKTLTRSQWVDLFPCILEIALSDQDNGGRERSGQTTYEMILQEPWLASGNISL